MNDSDVFLDCVAAIVEAYVSHNPIPRSDVPSVIAAVHAALAGLAQMSAPDAAPELHLRLLGSAPKAAPEARRLSRADIQRSITPDALVSFIDGKSYRTLRRHLGSYGLTPDAYRKRYGLPVDYPMVAASYSLQRSALAKGSGLGTKRKHDM